MATGGSDTTSTTSLQQAEYAPTTPGEVYRLRVLEDLGKLSQLTDVMLAAEGQSIPCHKVLLAAASNFFRDKLITNPESLEHNILDIDGIDFDTLTSIVSFIYSGKIELTVEKTEKLIPASVSLMLPELIAECKRFLEQVIKKDISTCVAVYRIVKAKYFRLTAKKIWKTMLENFETFRTTDGFKELSETELQEYIGDEELNVASEDPVFEALVTWVRHDMENRKDKFEALLEHVTLSHCSLNFLKDTVLQETLMKRGQCFQHAAAALAAQASSRSLRMGAPRKVQHCECCCSLVALYVDTKGYILRYGESEWEGKTGSRVIPSQSSVCRTGDGILITGGGEIDRRDRRSMSVVRQCYKFSLPTLNCTAVSSLKVARRSHASVCVGGTVYVLGGLSYGGFTASNTKVLLSMEYWNTNTRSWYVATDTCNLPEALFSHIAVNYKHNIYVFGGQNESLTNSVDTFVFDTVNKTWSKKAEMPQVCTEGSSVVYRDRIYVLGGKENCCMSYNPDQDQWKTHSRPRVNHTSGSAVVWGDRILLCGCVTLIEKYNPVTDTWTNWKYSLPEKDCRALFAARLVYPDTNNTV